MSFSSALLALVASAVPIGAYIVLLRFFSHREGRIRMALWTMALGTAAFALATAIERALERWSGLPKGEATVDLSALLYAFLVVAPLEQGLKVAAVVPALRSRFFREPVDGIVFASSSALGFVAAHNVAFLMTRPPSGLDLLRALLAMLAHPFLAAGWGYALGREPKKRFGGRRFDAAWLAAMLFNGIYDHIVFARGPAALWAALPIMLGIGVVALLGVRDLLRRGTVAPRSEPLSRRISLLPIAPPSIAAMREALLHSERPVTLRWIVFGALVTTGVMIVMLAFAVALGRELGVDFAAVDRAEGAAAGASPFVLLGSAALLAFPVAGYLIARASAARSVLEPAIAAGLAIVGSLVLLGLAAPISVVFAIACAPFAFGLACAGAWIGMTR